MKFSDITFEGMAPTIEEMAKEVHEMIGGVIPAEDPNQEEVVFLVPPWKSGEMPTVEEVVLVYKDKVQHLTGMYLQARLIQKKTIPVRFRKLLYRYMEPEAYFRELDSNERMLKISFELFLSTAKPSVEEAVQKLLQLSRDFFPYDGELTPEAAKLQIMDEYPNQIWREICLVK